VAAGNIVIDRMEPVGRGRAIEDVVFYDQKDFRAPASLARRPVTPGPAVHKVLRDQAASGIEYQFAARRSDSKEAMIWWKHRSG